LLKINNNIELAVTSETIVVVPFPNNVVITVLKDSKIIEVEFSSCVTYTFSMIENQRLRIFSSNQEN
jgi:hypothetical protein